MGVPSLWCRYSGGPRLKSLGTTVLENMSCKILKVPYYAPFQQVHIGLRGPTTVNLKFVA